MRILLIEDNAKVASFIRRGLKEENFTVDFAQDGEEGLFFHLNELSNIYAEASCRN